MQKTGAGCKDRPVKIMICDDDRAVQKIMQKKIDRFCADDQIACQILCCDSGEEVLVLKPTPDILFLDIQMPGRNGMEIAEELRKQHKDVILIFMTALSEYVYEAFDVGAFHYLVKPFQDEKLREVFERALEQYEKQQEVVALRQSRCSDRVGTSGEDGQTQETGTERNGQMYEPAAILVKRGGVSTKVHIGDIIYAEVFNRKVMLHTTDGDIEYYGKLTELSEQVGEDFYRTHRAYLVNFKYVEKYNADTVWLEKGTALVSKKQYAGFVRQYMRYINRKRGR